MPAGEKSRGLWVPVFEQKIHVGDGKNAVVDSIDAQKRSTGPTENPLIQGEFVLFQNLKIDKDITAPSGHLPLNRV
jgi:hypothetical protein